jgi:signal peptide peptidase SppA
MPKDQHVSAFVRQHPWAIRETKLSEILEFLELHARGISFSRDQIIARIDAAPPRPVTRQDGAVAVLPLFGVLSQRVNLLTDVSGGTSTEQFATALRQAIADPTVGAIVVQVDSPGGSVFGVQELADQLFAARRVKPVVAIADSLMASAAYWIASQAEQIVVTPGGEVGSIGVLAVYDDLSKAAEQAGVRKTFISAGRFKAEATGYEPLTGTAQAAIQKRVDQYFGMFVDAVARGRGVPRDRVVNGFGEGRVVGAMDALSLGMADRVGTLREAIMRAEGRGGAAVAARRRGGAIRAEAIGGRPSTPNLDFRKRRLRSLERDASRPGPAGRSGLSDVARRARLERLTRRGSTVEPALNDSARRRRFARVARLAR